MLDRMKTPATATTASGLRGEYAKADAGYCVAQDWSAYTPAMHDRWRRLYAAQAALSVGRACRAFRDGLARLDGGSGIPRLADANAALGPVSGWQLVAVPGYLPDAVFFEHLAHRRFPVTRWLREEHEFAYLVEPDIFHDFFGHVPMLFDPAVADFLQLYGEAGARAQDLGALDMLARLYWYTIEFGLVREEGGLRVLGAGIVSSAAETRFALEDPDVLRLRFDPLRVLRTAYRIDTFQQTYFVLDSLEDLIEALTWLDLAPYHERWREVPPIAPGACVPGETRLAANPSSNGKANLGDPA